MLIHKLYNDLEFHSRTLYSTEERRLDLFFVYCYNPLLPEVPFINTDGTPGTYTDSSGVFGYVDSNDARFHKVVGYINQSLSGASVVTSSNWDGGFQTPENMTPYIFCKSTVYKGMDSSHFVGCDFSDLHSACMADFMLQTGGSYKVELNIGEGSCPVPIAIGSQRDTSIGYEFVFENISRQGYPIPRQLSQGHVWYHEGVDRIYYPCMTYKYTDITNTNVREKHFYNPSVKGWVSCKNPKLVRQYA